MIEYYISSTKYTLQERQTKRGKVYDVAFRVIDLSGNEHQKKLCGYFTKTAAKEAYTEFVTNKCELVKNNPIKKKKAVEKNKNTCTVSDLFAQYTISLPNQAKESTIYDRQNIYRLFILPSLGDVKMYDLTKERLYQWQDQLWSTTNPKTGEFYSYAYLIKVRGLLSAFLSWAQTRHGFPNHLKEVERPKAKKNKKKKMEIWTRDEFERFIISVDDPVYHALFMTLFFTGCRKGEILALTPKDVEGPEIFINKAIMRKTLDKSPYKVMETKAYNERWVPVAAPLREELDRYAPTVQGEPFLFAGKRPLPQTNIDRAFNKAIRASGVNKIRIHDLRHSFVSMLIHLGANLTVVADLIGDTLEQVTKTYAHMYESDRTAVMTRIL